MKYVLYRASGVMPSTNHINYLDGFCLASVEDAYVDYLDYEKYGDVMIADELGDSKSYLFFSNSKGYCKTADDVSFDPDNPDYTPAGSKIRVDATDEQKGHALTLTKLVTVRTVEDIFDGRATREGLTGDALTTNQTTKQGHVDAINALDNMIDVIIWREDNLGIQATSHAAVAKGRQTEGTATRTVPVPFGIQI